MNRRKKINIDQLLVEGLASKTKFGKSAIQVENKLKAQSRGISGHKITFTEAPDCLRSFELVDFKISKVKMLEAIDAFVGANSGVMKGIYIKKAKFVNFHEESNSDETKTDKIENDLKSAGISAMSFTGSDQTEILVGRKNGKIVLLNTLTEKLNLLFEIEDESGIIGINSIKKDKILTASNSGSLAIWNENGQRISNLEWNAGENLLGLCLENGDSPNVFATGGKENPLKLWDIEEQKCKFTAKNVRPDNFELRVPIWVTNCRFLNSSANSIVTSTGNAEVRIYDVRSQRRPILQEKWMEVPIQALSTCCREWNVLVGNNLGELGLLDLRSISKSRMVSKYKGFAGAIRCIDASLNQPHFLSCGVDRFAILHNLDTREIIQKIYCKVQLNCCLLRDDNSLMDISKCPRKKQKRQIVKDI